MAEITSNKPRVTVYINTRNRADLLPRAIRSLENQTFKDFEVIIVDADSTDNTGEVIKEFIKNDSRIKYFHHENGTLASCLNFIISKANGEYITQLDDDDEYLPDKIKKQVELLENAPLKVGVVYCWEEFWDDNKNVKLYENKPNVRGDAYLSLLEKSCVGGGTTMMMRKSAFDYVGGFDETIRLGGDYQLNINLSKYFHHDFVPEILVRTHINHQYNRLSEMKVATMRHTDIIESVEKIMRDHKDKFDNNPHLRFRHFRSIMHSAAKIKEYKLFLLYLKLGLSIKNPLKVKVLYLLRGIKHLLFSR